MYVKNNMGCKRSVRFYTYEWVMIDSQNNWESAGNGLNWSFENRHLFESPIIETKIDSTINLFGTFLSIFFY